MKVKRSLQPKITLEAITPENCMWDVFYHSKCFLGFDTIITNLPFLANLFAYLLVKISDYLSNNGKIITINPANWFERTCTSDEKYHTVLEYLRDRVCGFLLIEMKAANKLFNISGQTDHGIFVISKNRVSDRIYPYPPIITSIIDKTQVLCEKLGSVYDHSVKGRTELDSNDAVINDMWGYRKSFKIVDTPETISTKSLKNRRSMSFSSPEEKEKFIQIQNSNLGRKFAYLTTPNQHTQLRYIPYLGNLQSVNAIITEVGFDPEELAYLLSGIKDPSKKDYIKYAIVLNDNGAIDFEDSNMVLPVAVITPAIDTVSKHTTIISIFLPKPSLSQDWQIPQQRYLSFGGTTSCIMAKLQVSSGYTYSNKHGPGAGSGISIRPLIRGAPFSSELKSNLRA